MMKRTFLKLVTALGLVAALYSPAFAAPAAFEVLTLENVQTLVKKSGGKVVVINFLASWCGPCKLEAPGLVAIRKKIGEDKLIMIGASLDEKDNELRAFMSKMKINFPIKKAGQDLLQAAGVEAIPHILVFDKKGEVVANESGLIPEEALLQFLQKTVEAK